MFDRLFKKKEEKIDENLMALSTCSKEEIQEVIKKDLPFSIAGVPMPKKTLKSRLLIRTTKDTEDHWFIVEVSQRKLFREPWLRFYHWYFNRSHSKQFIIKHKDGEKMIKRSTIIDFYVDIISERY